MVQGWIYVSPVSRLLFTLTLSCLMMQSTGCVGLWATLLHDQEMRPPKFTGLEEKKIAVLCVSGPSFYSETTTSRKVAEKVEALIDQRLKDVTIIPQQKIDDWKDRTGWNNTDYREAGKALGAEMVVAIDLARYEIESSPGLYKARAEYVVSVFDIDNDGELVFQDTPKPIVFPINGSAFEVESEHQFRHQFMQLLSHRIARNFYKYNGREDLMLDESFVSN